MPRCCRTASVVRRRERAANPMFRVATALHAVSGDTSPLPLEEYLCDSLRVDTPPLAGVVCSNMAHSPAGHLFAGVPPGGESR